MNKYTYEKDKNKKTKIIQKNKNSIAYFFKKSKEYFFESKKVFLKKSCISGVFPHLCTLIHKKV